MTPHRHSKGGTYMIDRVFGGSLRIHRASGTTDKATFRRIDAMLTELYGRGRLDILEAIRDLVVSPLQVLDATQRKGLDRLPTSESIVPLWTAIDAWLVSYLDTFPDRVKHQRDMWYGINKLMERATINATVQDLPRMLLAYKRMCRQKHPTFNHTKAYVQAFVTDTLGTTHTVYREIQAIPGYPKARKRHPVHLTPDEARDVVASMDKYGAEVWALLVTGMNPKEYWGRWDIKADHVAVYGTKREGRYRRVPLVDTIIRPRCNHHRQVANALQHVRPDMQLKDCRNIAARWMAKSGIISANLKAYMGWSATTMADTYQWDELFRDVAEDGAKLRAYLGVTPHKMEVVK